MEHVSMKVPYVHVCNFIYNCVSFISGDFVGYILAWCSLLPIFSIVGFITLILFRRDLHTVSYLHVFHYFWKIYIL